MWSALENMALRESLPTPLLAGDSVHGILVAGQIPGGRYRIHHLGHRHSRPYLLRQFYSLDTDAFLRWQNETRFIGMPETDGFSWASEEWRGGVIAPHPGGMTLTRWLKEDHSMKARLAVAARLAGRMATLHNAGITLRRLTPAAVNVAGHDAFIMDFGHAVRRGWDDLWTDTPRMPADLINASPEVLNGQESGPAEDVYAFGSLLHLLLAGQPAFSPMKRRFRPYLPGLIRPGELPKGLAIPAPVREIAEACMAASPEQRPDFTELARQFAEYGETGIRERSGADVENDIPAGRRLRQMVFIKDDTRAVNLFDRVIELASGAPSLFLFVGMVPGHLPSGHMERFKGSLLQKLAQGLLRCREANVRWSLRVFDNTVPETAARQVAEAYEPDRVLIGESSSKHGFETRFKGLETDVEIIA